MTRKRKISATEDGKLQETSRCIKSTSLSPPEECHHTVKHKKRKLSKKKEIQQQKLSKKTPDCDSGSDYVCDRATVTKNVKSGKNSTSKNHKELDIVYPKLSGAVSANWKKLQKELNIGKKKSKRKAKATSEEKIAVTSVPSIESSKCPEPEIWFDGVDDVLIESSRNNPSTDEVSAKDWDSVKNPLVKTDSFSGLTRIVAMDCEMVGVGEGGEDSILARASVVNQFGQCIYDKLVRPTEDVVDYRTQYSGIHEGDLDSGEDFKAVQTDVSNIIKDRILVGHAIHNDLKVLYLDHPKKKIRDTSKYKPFRKLNQGKTPSLKKLSNLVLGVKVQEGEHNSIQDAQAAMRLYTMHRKTWEKELKMKKTIQKVKDKAQKIHQSPISKSEYGNLLDSDDDS